MPWNPANIDTTVMDEYLASIAITVLIFPSIYIPSLNWLNCLHLCCEWHCNCWFIRLMFVVLYGRVDSVSVWNCRWCPYVHSDGSCPRHHQVPHQTGDCRLSEKWTTPRLHRLCSTQGRFPCFVADFLPFFTHISYDNTPHYIITIAATATVYLYLTGLLSMVTIA